MADTVREIFNRSRKEIRIPTGNIIAGVRETESISEFDEDAAITALRTLVLAEVEKMKRKFPDGHDTGNNECAICGQIIGHNACLVKVQQALTKLFEGGKEALK